MLTQAVESYLAVRRAAGFGLRVTASLLRSYARFAVERGDTHVRSDTAIAWAALGRSPAQREQRLRRVITLARHVLAEDPQHEVPPEQVFGRHRPRHLAYIYSPDDIRRLLDAAGRLPPAGSLRPLTYQTLFGLLAACGLRRGEAIALRLENVTSDGLVIRETKFRKSRVVPMHSTTAAALDRYVERRERVGSGDDHLFVSLRGTALHGSDVHYTFLKLARGLGLRAGAGRAGPRIHDLRHTFAVRALEACPGGRREISRHVVALSTYLGHSDVGATYWYLQATPQLMTGIADACQTFIHGVQP